MSDSMMPPPEDFHQPRTAPEAPPARRGAGPLFWVVLGLILFGFFFFTVIATIVGVIADRQASPELWFPGAKVAVIPLEGGIFESADTIDEIERYANTRAVKAIVIRINSPGGAIVPSQELYSEIRRIRAESGKPIIASLDSVAASGGYYVAAACDSIVASPGSITGSIGVIMQWMNMEELIAWARLKPETFASGAMKDTGSPFHETTDAEKAYLQGIVQQLHNQFVRAVAEGRAGKLTEAEVAKLADGRVFTGEEAKRLKLVDELGGLNDAIEIAAGMAGISGEPDTVSPRRRNERGLLDSLLGSARIDRMMNSITAQRSIRFLYQW